MILLGVKEDLKETDTARRFVIMGVEDSRKMKKEFWDTLNSNKVNKRQDGMYQAMCHIVKRVGGDKGGHWEVIK